MGCTDGDDDVQMFWYKTLVENESLPVGRAGHERDLNLENTQSSGSTDRNELNRPGAESSQLTGETRPDRISQVGTDPRKQLGPHNHDLTELQQTLIRRKQILSCQ